jgi:glycosyltransferase involved in cell wall biosynthesis
VGRPAISIVVPARNEAERLESTLRALWVACEACNAEVVVVDDGSTDATADIAEAALKGRGHVLRLGRHRGKGAAVRAGVLSAHADEAVFFMDADLATNLEALPRFAAALEQADVVVSSRALDEAVVRDARWYRAVMGRTFNALVRHTAGLRVSDTQCGFKAFRPSTARRLFSLARSNGFAFDVEVLLLAQRLNLKVIELPVTWTAVSGSSVRPVTDSLEMTVDVARIVRRWRRRHFSESALGDECPTNIGPSQVTKTEARQTRAV